MGEYCNVVSEDDITVLTHCRWRGHTVKKSVVDGLGNNDCREAVCEKCHFPVWVCIDPDDDGYYLISEYEQNLSEGTAANS